MNHAVRHGVILLDPPWHYNNRKTGGERCDKTKFGGGAMKHYDLIKDKRMLRYARFLRSRLGIIAAKDCAMFMWTTGPRLDFGIEVLKAAGFRYTTTQFTWIKTKKDCEFEPIYGPGYYTASNPEFVIGGVRGSMRPTKKMSPSVIFHPRMEHSRKPDIHPMIEAMYPDVPKLELFARRQYPGWVAWGNEVNDIIIPVSQYEQMGLFK
jgi:N6-adenosine-specific RNA methylase IME4